MTQQSERIIRAPLDRVRALLLRPLELPQWNAAFITLNGPAEPTEGVQYALTVRVGLTGTFGYDHIGAKRIDMSWHTTGFHESGTWLLEPQGDTTRVVHGFDHRGGLARTLRYAFRRVADERLRRLGERAERR